MSRTTKVPWRMSREKRVVFLDADGILYSAALKGVTFCDGDQLQMLDDEAVFEACVEGLEKTMAWVGDVGEVYICLSARHNFRKDVLTTYKANRKEGSRPITLDALRGRIMGEGVPGYRTLLIKDLEADDVCGIAASSFQQKGYETLIVSPDKDLLQIPGMVLTPKPGWPPELVFSEVTPETAEAWHYYQALVGDPVDNYKGCPGVGAKKAQKLLDTFEVMSHKERWEAAVALFEKAGLTEADALVQFQVSRILTADLWDATNKEVILWQPPI